MTLWSGQGLKALAGCGTDASRCYKRSKKHGKLYFITLLTDVTQFAEAVRMHWCIENSFNRIIFGSSSSVIKQLLLHSCPYTFTSCIIMASSSCTVHTLDYVIFLDSGSVRRTCILAAPIGMYNCSANIRIP